LCLVSLSFLLKCPSSVILYALKATTNKKREKNDNLDILIVLGFERKSKKNPRLARFFIFIYYFILHGFID